jgi:DNA-binding protein YbaB
VKSHLIKTDEAIINEYFKLYDLFGETKECCNEIRKLIKNITPEKQTLWASILNAVLYSFMCNKKFLKSYTELDKITIENKESPQFIFVEREKMYAFALIDKNNITETLSVYGKLKKHFSNNTDHAIQLQIAQTMLTESYLLNKFGDFNKELIIDDELIKTFSNSDHISIQIVVAKCINNKGTTLKQIFKDKKETQIIKLRNKIISVNKHTTDVRMQIQVAKSMLVKADDLQDWMKIERLQAGTAHRRDKENIKNVISTYEILIETFGYSNITIIQEIVANAMYLLINILVNIDLKKCFDIHHTLKNNAKKMKNNEIISLFYLYASKTILYILLQKGRLDEHEKILTEVIEILNNSKYSNIQKMIEEFLIQKIEILRQQEEYEECLKIMAILDKKNPTIPFLKLLKPQILNEKAEVLENDNNYEEALNLYEQIINEFSSSGIDEVQQIVNTAKYKKVFLPQKIIRKQRIEENKIKMEEVFAFYLDNKRSINDLIKSITKKHITPLIGAGLSAFADYPLWLDFLNKIYKNPNYKIKDKISEENFDSMSCIKKASAIYNILEQARFLREIKHYFSDTKMNNVSNEILREQPLYLLPELFKEQLILTTNFDNLIQRVYETSNEHIIPTSIVSIEMLDSLSTTKTVLYKIHGTIDVPKSIVLTEEDYRRHYDKNSLNYKILNSRMKGKEILFLGCGLNEDDEILTFSANADNYTIYPCNSNDKGIIEKVAQKLSGKGITPILYHPKNKHVYLKIILEYIVDSIYLKENDNFKTALLEQAKSLQGRVVNAQSELGEKVIVGTSENNCVIVKMSGKYDIIDLKINEYYVDYTKEELEYSILSALQNAKEQVDITIDETMEEATLGLLEYFE